MFAEVGFFGRGKTGTGQLDPEDSTAIPDSETLFRFDSGRKLKLPQGTRSVAIMGGTGSGKTTGVVLPMISNMIKNGCCGIILDVKGNLRETVRAVASAHGRLDDIVEFGSHETANKTDFLNGLADHEVNELMASLAVDGIGETGNMNFYQHGGWIYYDVYRCLKDISKIHPGCHFSRQFRPTLAKVYQTVNNNAFAAGLWTFYVTSLKNALEKYNGHVPQYLADAKSFVNNVNNDNFHVLKQMIQPRNYNYWDQLSYAVNHINGAFKCLEMTHGLLERFSCQDSESVPMDFDRLIYKDKKIVLVHFAMDSGYAGDILSRTIKSRFYQSVIRNGLNSKELTFMVGDEFQAIVDVDSRSRMNDITFFSISREYKNINIIATQSLASLMSKGCKNSIMSVLSNCMTKIFLQCTDPDTNKWVQEICEGYKVPLKLLKKGSCFVEYASHNGSLVDAIDSLNESYKETAEITDAYQEKEAVKKSKKKKEYATGVAGLPYVVSELLMMPNQKQDNTNDKITESAKRSFNRSAKEMFEKLDHLRDESIKGNKYWEISTNQ